MFQDGTACAGTRTVVVRADRIDCARRVEDPAFFGSSVFWGGIAAWGKTQVGPILHPFGMKTEDFIPPTGICNPPPKKKLERTLFRSAKDDTVLGPGLTPKNRRADAIPLRSVCSEPYSSHWHRCHQTQGLFVTSFYSSFADWHFAEKPRPSLLAGLAARIDGTNIVQALSCGCQPLQDLAWRRMAELSEPQLTVLVEPWLQSDPASIERYAVTAVVLKGLAHETLAVSDAILARVVSLMESPSAEVRLAAATVVALRQPVEAIALLRRGDPVDRDVLRRLCLADDPALIVPLMTAFGFPRTPPPPTIGFVAAPIWLADFHAREPQLVEWLIRHCGYCDDEVTAEVVNLLSSGFSYVTTRMTSEPRMTKIAHRWQRRIRAFVWRLLPGELGLQPDDTKPFDVADPLDIDLFLAAVRDSDRMLFLEQKSRPPFGRAGAKREPAPSCFHAPSRHVRRMFVDEPLSLAERGNIPQTRRGDFLIEQARVLLEPNDEARLAADLALRGKWLTPTVGSPVAE